MYYFESRVLFVVAISDHRLFLWDMLWCTTARVSLLTQRFTFMKIVNLNSIQFTRMTVYNSSLRIIHLAKRPFR